MSSKFSSKTSTTSPSERWKLQAGRLTRGIFWIGYFAILAVLIASFLKDAHAGGTGGPEPSHIVCLLFDMSTPTGKQWKGWHPVSKEARDQISRDVGAGKAEWIEADTLECIERHPMNKNIGKVIRTERVEWWRWKEPKKAASHD
jgi:hypothetical protein